MLGSVLWMFVQDYNREFKPIQRTFYDVEEQASLRVMLQQLPRGEDLEQKINKAEAARILGLARSTFVSRLKKHGLS